MKKKQVHGSSDLWKMHNKNLTKSQDIYRGILLSLVYITCHFHAQKTDFIVSFVLEYVLMAFVLWHLIVVFVCMSCVLMCYLSIDFGFVFVYSHGFLHPRLIRSLSLVSFLIPPFYFLLIRLFSSFPLFAFSFTSLYSVSFSKYLTFVIPSSEFLSQFVSSLSPSSSSTFLCPSPSQFFSSPSLLFFLASQLPLLHNPSVGLSFPISFLRP